MPACLLYVSFWSEALKGWIHTVYWKCLQRSHVTASTGTELQPVQISHNRKPVLKRPAPLMVIHSAGKHSEKLFRLCYNPATGSHRWSDGGERWPTKDTKREGIQEKNMKKKGERDKSLLIWPRSSSHFHPGLGLIMFTPFEPVKNQVAMHSFKAINNAQHSIDEHIHARPLTVECVPLGRQEVRRTLLSVVPSTDPAYREAREHNHTLFGLFVA